MKNVKLIGCASSKNEILSLGVPENVDAEFLDFGHHAYPDKLHELLQEKVNESQHYELIIFTYGRCSKAVNGLVSPQVPLLFPATHDCIGFLLGSNRKYREMMAANPATYFFSQGWLDYGQDPLEEYHSYVEKYGEKRARIIIDTLYGRYRRAVLIHTPGMNDVEHYRRRVSEIAAFFDWTVEEVTGDPVLLKGVLAGQRHPELVYVEPGEVVTEALFLEKHTG